MKTEDNLKKSKYKVAAFYKFLSILEQDIFLFKEELINLATKKEIKGTVLIACEGVNGTVWTAKTRSTILE